MSDLIRRIEQALSERNSAGSQREVISTTGCNERTGPFADSSTIAVTKNKKYKILYEKKIDVH